MTISAQRSVTTIGTGAPDQLTLFAVLWAAATLFHTLAPISNGRGILLSPSTAGIAQGLLATAAVWLLARPAQNLPLAVVAVLGPVTAWLDAPQLGSHWMLATLVNLAVLPAMLLARRDGRIDRARLAEVFLPIACWCLLLFYCFAAFAKLNTDFLDPAVSCSTYFFGETFGSAAATSGPAALVPYATAATELSIPFLLSVRRTRAAGVVLGLLFHSTIALDLAHLFYDFTSLLVALFVLFLPAGFATSTLRVLRGPAAPALLVGRCAAVVVLVAQWVAAGPGLVVYGGGTVVGWWLFDTAVLVGVGAWLVRHRGGVPLEHPFRVPGGLPLLLSAVPLLLVVNGVLPYLELRTAYAFTMYSNLRMVDGTSNHLLVRASLPIAGRQSGLVTLVSSSDPQLRQYAVEDWLLPWDSFRAYLAERPEVAVDYVRDGRRVTLAHASDDPALVEPPPLPVQKLLAMRAVDGGARSRCQSGFLPAL